MITNLDIGNDPVFKRFDKGVTVLKPQKPKYDFVWDSSPVLRYLESFPSNEDLTLKEMTLKLVMLLALGTAHRLQT